MKTPKYKTVADYIAQSAEEAGPIMETLRKVIISTIPDAEETISWNVPIYKYHGILAGFSVAKQHVSFGVDALTTENRETLKKQGYKTGKKTIQIKFDQDVPVEILRKTLKAQAKINEAKTKQP